MKLRKLASLLMLGVVLGIATFAAHAQTGYGKCHDRLPAGGRAQPVEETTAAAPVADQFEAQQSGVLDVLERQKKAIVGSWFVNLGCGCKVLLSFGSDGVFQAVGQGDIQPVGSPNPSSTAAYGAWAHNGGRQFAVTFLIIGYDVPTSEFRGTLKVRIALTLNEAGDQLTGTDKAEIFDPDGKLLGAFTTGAMQGARIKVEPLN